MKNRFTLALGALALTVAMAGTATATLTEERGRNQLSVDKRTNNLPQSTSSLDWETLDGSVELKLAEGDSVLVDVPSFAESRCAGQNAGRCVMRIMAEPDVGMPIELSPAAGNDYYAFDTDLPGAADDGWEGHGLERSARLTGDDDGTTWEIKVQYAVTNQNTMFTLDDTHLAVITNA